jgi:hypothetical protein
VQDSFRTDHVGGPGRGACEGREDAGGPLHFTSLASPGHVLLLLTSEDTLLCVSACVGSV